MNLNKYQKLAKRTIPKKFDNEELLLNAVLGLCGESGEVADLYKKVKFQGHTTDHEKLISELGDVLWYIAEAATALQIDLNEIARQNINKLIKRYPDGFNSDKSINREENKQNKICNLCFYKNYLNCSATQHHITRNLDTKKIIRCAKFKNKNE